jgi:hypothetical protein
MTVASQTHMLPFAQAEPATDDGASISTHHQALLSAAAALRDELRSKRTATLSHLFEFLLARTMKGCPPTELDIANEVFSDGRVIDSTRDSTVRVYVHRLRKLAESVYADRVGPALEIRKGEYSIHIKEQMSPEQSGAAIPDRSRVVAGGALVKLTWPLCVLSGALILAFLIYFVQRSAVDPLAATAFWRPIATSARPTTIVLGDQYLFAQTGPQGANPAAPRLVWDRSIAAREDIYVYLMRNPDQAESIADLNQHYVSSSSVTALRDIRAVLMAVKGNHRGQIRVISSSQLTPDILKSSDIVYVGQLGGLSPLLREPLFQASGLKIGSTFDEMIDRASGKTFRSDGVVLTEERIPRRDYGYIARLPGPSRNNIVVVAGTRDAGLLEMAELLRTAERLDAARLPAASTLHGMEALYRVRTIGSVNLGSSLILKRKLHSQGIWDKSWFAPPRP